MNRSFLPASLALAIALMAGSAAPAIAAPLDGAIDLSFGTNGRTVIGVDTAPSSPLDIVTDTVVDSFGRVHLVGVVNTTDGQRIGIARLRADGTLDQNYGPDDVGLVVAPEQTGFSLTGVSAAFDAQGRLLVGGTLTTAGNDDFAVCRFNVDGALTAFPNGFQCVKVAFDLGDGNDDVLRDIAVQPDGKIVLAGSADFSVGNERAALARLDSSGNLDAAFNGTGKMTLANGFAYNTFRLNAIAIASNGKIVGVGEGLTTPEPASEAVAARVLANGTADTSFGLNGVAPVERDTGRDMRFKALALIPGSSPDVDQRIVAVGEIETAPDSGSYDGFIAALRVLGNPDLDFSGDGVQSDATGANLSFTDLEREATGNLTVVGTIRANTNPATTLDFYATRYLRDGTRDLGAFNPGVGYRLVDFLQPGGNDIANAVAFADDRIIVAGASLISTGTPVNLDFSVMALTRDRIFANGVD